MDSLISLLPVGRMVTRIIQEVTEKSKILQTKVVSLLQLCNYTGLVENKSEAKPR